MNRLLHPSSRNRVRLKAVSLTRPELAALWLRQRSVELERIGLAAAKRDLAYFSFSAATLALLEWIFPDMLSLPSLVPSKRPSSDDCPISAPLLRLCLMSGLAPLVDLALTNSAAAPFNPSFWLSLERAYSSGYAVPLLLLPSPACVRCRQEANLPWSRLRRFLERIGFIPSLSWTIDLLRAASAELAGRYVWVGAWQLMAPLLVRMLRVFPRLLIWQSQVWTVSTLVFMILGNVLGGRLRRTIQAILPWLEAESLRAGYALSAVMWARVAFKLATRLLLPAYAKWLFGPAYTSIAASPVVAACVTAEPLSGEAAAQHLSYKLLMALLVGHVTYTLAVPDRGLFERRRTMSDLLSDGRVSFQHIWRLRRLLRLAFAFLSAAELTRVAFSPHGGLLVALAAHMGMATLSQAVRRSTLDNLKGSAL